MLRILNGSFQTQAVINKVISAKRTETINAENILEVECVLDSKTLTYIVSNNVIELDGDYFDIAYYEQTKSADGTSTVRVEAEHVSYRLNSNSLNTFTKVSKTPTQILTDLFASTVFTVGTVSFATPVSFSILEPASKRQVLVSFAEYLGGELDFNGTSISILTARGDSSPKLFTANKNIEVLRRIYDRGTVKYDCAGINIPSKQVALGDNILVVDADLNIQQTVRVVRLEYDPFNNMDVKFELSNYVESVADSIYKIQTETISKEKVYNGAKIGPDEGIVVERSDGKAKTVMNATDGISVYADTGAGLQKNFYVDTAGRIQAKNIDISGTGTFGGSITVGTGNDVFKVDSTGRMWLGNANFSSAPFTVTASGELNAKDAYIDGQFVTTLSNKTMSEFYADTTGGYIFLNNYSAKRVMQIGSDPYDQTGLILVYNGLNNGGATGSSSIRAEIGVINDNGRMALYQTGGTFKYGLALEIDSSGGYFNIFNSDDERIIYLGYSGTTNKTGNLYCYDGGGDTRARFGVSTSTEDGILQLYNGSGNVVLEGSVDGSGAGAFVITNSSGSARVAFLVSTATNTPGLLALYSSNGDYAVLRYNGTNLQVSKSGGSWINVA